MTEDKAGHDKTGQEWIKKLASAIKEKDAQVAETNAKKQHRDEILRTKGHAFYDAACKQIGAYGQELVRSLAGDPTQSNFTMQPDGPSLFKFARQAYPYFEGDASWDATKAIITVSYKKANPVANYPLATTPMQEQTVKFVIEVGEKEAVFAQEMFGQEIEKYDHPHELARFLFTQFVSV